MSVNVLFGFITNLQIFVQDLQADDEPEKQSILARALYSDSSSEEESDKAKNSKKSPVSFCMQTAKLSVKPSHNHKFDS